MIYRQIPFTWPKNSRLNADRGLTKGQRIAYILLNWASNQFPESNLDPALALKKFRPHGWEQSWSRLDTKTSPSRRLSDLFWSTLPWADIYEELGPIHVLDTGCGNGRYGEYLHNFSEGRIASYFGLDPREHTNWQDLANRHPNFRFKKTTASTLSEGIPDGTNMFITQSALEHIDEDLGYFEAMRSYIDQQDSPVLQVHLIPSAACLRLYLWHGIRQYTPRTISRITRLFNEKSYSALYSLGGKACNSVYWKFVTLPKRLLRRGDYRETRTEQYEAQILQAISRDLAETEKTPSVDANFFALIIHSNWQRKLFG